ncbi:hypothetical protein [Mucilaginibacter sp. UR6-11]|uniref:hypothetical protein n=1 Tax=Mucilaginibacter sp. UR6-11 TaxID=1435644 RepID=UPI001E50F8EB|nr:hypothetical protein [Mucilaginibacter sp. UR6-11]MCC8426458.1 hypothetical protein [Mucilaginibacter sp. UR6-11]
MKNLAYVSFALFMLIALIEGCQKTQGVKPGEIVASKTTVKYNEPDTLVLLGADNDSVKWGVTPSGFSQIHAVGNKAVIQFLKAGTYTVSAASNDGAPATRAITVLDVNYNPPVTDNPAPPADPAFTHIPVTGDIVITPTYFKMPHGDSTYFVLTAQTSNPYPCGNSSLNTNQSQTNNNYILNIPDIIQPNAGQCALPNTPLKRIVAFYPLVASPITLGTTYPLTIKVGSTTYTGVITFNSTYMDIVWNYTSGVTMSATHITL